MPIIPDPASAAATAPAEAPQNPADSLQGLAEDPNPMDQVPEYPDVPELASSVVTLVFPEAVCPERLVFVLHQMGSDTWVRDHGE
jgi:hypothetical protein